MAILLAYYSWKGHTEKIATALAGLLGAELVQIQPAGNLHIGREAMKAFFGWSSPIRPAKFDLAGVDVFIVATPVWAGKVPPFVNEYLSAVTGGSGKPFYVIAEMGGSGDRSAIARVRKALEAKGMRFVSSVTTLEKDVESGAFVKTLETFAAGIKPQ